MKRICPNCDISMHNVKMLSHYDVPIILDQCERCGGVWTDDMESHRAKFGEGERIELINKQKLSENVVIKNGLLCPRDGVGLVEHTNPLFPEHIKVETCMECNGLWFNYGELTAFQKHREEHKDQMREKTIERINDLLGHEEGDSATSVIKRIGSLLNKEVPRNSVGMPVNIGGVASGVIVDLMSTLAEGLNDPKK